jgi:hypothetical protein
MQLRSCCSGHAVQGFRRRRSRSLTYHASEVDGHVLDVINSVNCNLELLSY